VGLLVTADMAVGCFSITYIHPGRRFLPGMCLTVPCVCVGGGVFHPPPRLPPGVEAILSCNSGAALIGANARDQGANHVVALMGYGNMHKGQAMCLGMSVMPHQAACNQIHMIFSFCVLRSNCIVPAEQQ
jgi:hypothetical protein